MKLMIIFIFAVLLVYSCNEDSRIIKEIRLVQIRGYQIPDTANTNNTVHLLINTEATNGCWSNLFAQLSKTSNYNYRIKAYGTFTCLEGGCACPDVMVYKDTIINFIPENPGKYIFEIYMHSKHIEFDTLVVN